MLKISGLYIYPIKSLAGISMPSARLTSRGLQHDRRWMLIDTGNRFMSQREVPEMALCKTRLTPDGIQVSYSKMTAGLLVPFIPQSSTTVQVTVWDDTCLGQLVSPVADAWFTEALGRPCRLVYMPDDSHRQVDPDYAAPGHINSFSDAYPCLLIGEASIADLSQRTGQAIPMNRFRPNIVFTGGAPYGEDELAHFKIGEIDFYGVKICARCPVPGIDQETAMRQKEPLKTLAGFRRKNNKVYLGQNLLHQGQGDLHIGDELQVLATKAAPVFA